MARTVTEIQTQIIEQVNTNLPALTSTSSTAVWRMWTYLIATAIYLFEKILDTDKANLETAIAAKRFGSLTWYKDAALAFQDGYDLQITSEGIIQYELLDETKQIITRASVSEAAGKLTLKVAKKLTEDALQPLTSEELLRFKNYIEKMKVAGTEINCISVNADVLKVVGTIYYNAIYDLNTIKTNLKNALNNYRNTFPFDGVIRTNALVDAIQQTIGIADVELSLLTLTNATGTVNVGRQALTQSGYFNYDLGGKTDFVELFTFTPAA